MKAITLRESPVPVLAILAGLFGFVEYLHWSVVQREERVEIVAVPAAPPEQGSVETGDEAGGFGALREPEIPRSVGRGDAAHGALSSRSCRRCSPCCAPRVWRRSPTI